MPPATSVPTTIHKNAGTQPHATPIPTPVIDTSPTLAAVWYPNSSQRLQAL